MMTFAVSNKWVLAHFKRGQGTPQGEGRTCTGNIKDIKN